MKITLSLSPPAQVEIECLVAVVLDRGEKDKTDAFVSASDKAVLQAASDVISSGDVTAKSFETTWRTLPLDSKPSVCFSSEEVNPNHSQQRNSASLPVQRFALSSLGICGVWRFCCRKKFRPLKG